MDLNQPGIIVFDTETTGTDMEHDQLIELTVQQGLSSEAPQQTWRIKPSIPVPREAQAIHGISTEDLKDCPPFSALADQIRGAFAMPQVIIGYNLEFDLKMLQREFVRNGKPQLELADKLLVDPLRLWRHFEPRRLEDAYRRFVGGELPSFHSSAVDVRATAQVFCGMMNLFQATDFSWDELASLSNPYRRSWIGPSHHFQWRSGIAIIAFGKHSGKTLSQLALEENGGYLRWIVERDFPEHVKSVAAKALALSGDDFTQWLESNFQKSS